MILEFEILKYLNMSTFTVDQVNEQIKRNWEKHRELLTEIICELNTHDKYIGICEGSDIKDGIIEYCTCWSTESGIIMNCEYCCDGPQLCKSHAKGVYFVHIHEGILCKTCYEEIEEDEEEEDEEENEEENDEENDEEM